jgi:hypothetical protein
MRKRSIPQIDQLSKESQSLLDVLNNENDLSVILVGTVLLVVWVMAKHW